MKIAHTIYYSVVGNKMNNFVRKSAFSACYAYNINVLYMYTDDEKNKKR